MPGEFVSEGRACPFRVITSVRRTRLYGIVHRASGRSGVWDVVERVTEALAHEGFGILADVDVRAKFEEKPGLDEFRRDRILGACNPPLARQGLDAEADLGCFSRVMSSWMELTTARWVWALSIPRRCWRQSTTWLSTQVPRAWASGSTGSWSALLRSAARRRCYARPTDARATCSRNRPAGYVRRIQHAARSCAVEDGRAEKGTAAA